MNELKRIKTVQNLLFGWKSKIKGYEKFEKFFSSILGKQIKSYCQRAGSALCKVTVDDKKTEISANVPLLPQAADIIEKYKDHNACTVTGKLLPMKSNQKMNAYLKEIADLCGIDKNLTIPHGQAYLCNYAHIRE